MGNCQTAEAATVVLQRPGGALERIYCSVSSSEVMASNPGYYVAAVTVSARSENGAPVKQLKLLHPDDTLHVGQVYCLVSFEEILKEFAEKKYTKLSRVLIQKQREERRRHQQREKSAQGAGAYGVGSSNRSTGLAQQRQWKPALHSIAEIGS